MEKQRVLILGSSGFIGSELVIQLQNEYEIIGTYHSKKNVMGENGRYLDIATDGIKELLESVDPDIILSSLRGDFTDQKRVHTYIADYMQQRPDKKLIFLSTANVFDKELEIPHYEEDRLNPKSDYGTYKAQCEMLLRQRLKDQCIILRIPAVWGKECPRIVSLRTEESIFSVSHFLINITSCEQIASYIRFILKEGKVGIFHIGTDDLIDYNELQKMVCKRLYIPLPKFEIETYKKIAYQALKTNRTDLPRSLKRTIQQIIRGCI